jgi:GT2 family glycosyltransferase
MLKKISIISVNYNQPQVTEEFLRSIAQHNSYAPIEVIVVDNGSVDDHTPAWSTEFPEATFIRSELNLGFAGGNNLGIRKATGDHLFFVNNDTEFTPGLLEKLSEVLEKNPQAGLVSPKIRYFDQPDILQYAGYTSMNYFTARNKCIGQYEEDKGQYDSFTGPTAYAHGAAMMTRREVIEKSGPMPEDYFLYYEEMDWCERIRRAGYEIWIEPRALIYHKESVSVGRNSPLKEYYMNRNRILFIRRNAPAFSRIVFYFYFLLVVSPRNMLSYLANGDFKRAAAFFRAIGWNLRH